MEGDGCAQRRAIVDGILALYAARLGQGIAGGCIWAGGLSWFIGASRLQPESSWIM